jgi:type VI secretion system secreted protein VgrG
LVMAVAAVMPAFGSSINLGTATSFAVLGGAGVTVAGAATTTISGNLGDYPLFLASITGFPPGVVVNGTMYAAGQGSAIAQQAQTDENTAYSDLAALTGGVSETGVTLGTGGSVSTLTPGVYSFSSSAQVDGALTLNFNGESNAVFVFQIGSTLTTGSSASIVVENGNATDAIFWQVGSSATLGSATTFAGNILASASITLGTTASIDCGRAFADTGSVTMDGGNFISNNCNIENTPTGYSSTGPTDFGSLGFAGNSSGVPEPGTVPLLFVGLLALTLYGWQLRRRALYGGCGPTSAPPWSARRFPRLSARS